MPFVSVVMPIRNEEDFIERGLRSVFAQNYPPDLLELIIADGESDDSTLEIIEKLKSETDYSDKNYKKPQTNRAERFESGDCRSKRRNYRSS